MGSYSLAPFPPKLKPTRKPLQYVVYDEIYTKPRSRPLTPPVSRLNPGWSIHFTALGRAWAGYPSRCPPLSIIATVSAAGTHASTGLACDPRAELL